MIYEGVAEKALNYFPCRYGNSKLLFRGPRRRLQDDFVAYLGGIETYGKFMETPYPILVEHDTGIKAVNLGCANAGIDAYVGDKSLIDICSKAKVTVIQVMGAQNMSNRFYAVHPRRNDRFLRASSLLKNIYGEIDFTNYNFTRHMLTSLFKASPKKFMAVEQELKKAWVARMITLIELIGGKVILLWLASHAPGPGRGSFDQGLEPLFIDRDMVENLSDVGANVVEVVANPNEISEGIHEMVYGAMEQPAAEEMLGPIVHRRAAHTLAPVLQNLI